MAVVLVGCSSEDSSSTEDLGRIALAQNNGKVVLCHVPPGDPAERYTITVPTAAAAAHTAHGDTFGACASGCGSNAACDDGDLCTSDVCLPTGECEHTLVSCDDGDACTQDSCSASTGCVYAPSTACQPDNTCATYSASGQAGAPCSNGPNPAWPRGDGSDLTCACSGGSVCITSGPPGSVATGAEQGVCCQNTAFCPADTCGASVTNTCTGEAIPCGCASGYFCENQACVRMETCVSLGKTGTIGSECNDNAFYERGDGAKFACPCRTSGGFTNASCTHDSPSSAGVCTCIPRTCTSCVSNGEPDGCGGTLNCACP